MSRYLVLSIALLWPTYAASQPAGAQAEVLFRQGRELLAAGKLGEACTAFEESQRLEKAINTLINLASCRERNSQLATAWGLYLEVERQTRDSTESAAAQLHGIAAEHATKLESRISKLTINVPPTTVIDGLEVSRDNERVESAMWSRALPIDSGTYTVTAKAPNRATWTATIAFTAEHETKTVDIPPLSPLPRASDTHQAASKRVAASSPASRPSRLVPIIVGASAVALMGGAFGFELWGDSTYDRAKAETTNQAHRDSLESSADHKRYAAEVFAFGGAATLGAAIWMYLRSDSEQAPTRTSHFVVSPTGLAFAGAF